MIEVGVKPNLQSRVQMLIIQLKLLMKIQKMKVRPKNILIRGKKTDSREKKKRQIREGKRTESLQSRMIPHGMVPEMTFLKGCPNHQKLSQSMTLQIQQSLRSRRRRRRATEKNVRRKDNRGQIREMILLPKKRNARARGKREIGSSRNQTCRFTDQEWADFHPKR